MVRSEGEPERVCLSQEERLLVAASLGKIVTVKRPEDFGPDLQMEAQRLINLLDPKIIKVGGEIGFTGGFFDSGKSILGATNIGSVGANFEGKNDVFKIGGPVEYLLVGGYIVIKMNIRRGVDGLAFECGGATNDVLRGYQTRTVLGYGRDNLVLQELSLHEPVVYRWGFFDFSYWNEHFIWKKS